LTVVKLGEKVQLAKKFQRLGDDFHKYSLFFSKHKPELAITTGMLSQVCYDLAKSTLSKAESDKYELKQFIQKEIQNLQKLLEEIK